MHNFTEDKRTSSQMSLRLVSPSATMDLTISYTSSLLHTSHTPSHASTSSCRGTQANTQGRQSHGATGSLAGPIGFIQGNQAGEAKAMLLNESRATAPAQLIRSPLPCSIEWTPVPPCVQASMVQVP